MYKPTKEETEQWDKAFAELIAWENEIHEHNKNIIAELNIPYKEMVILMNGCKFSSYERISIVDKPNGTLQENDSDYFKKVWVDQWSVGMEGDSYEGHIYAYIDDKKWLKISYSC